MAIISGEKGLRTKGTSLPIIINGNMAIAQRGTSFANVGDGVYTIDRFETHKNTDGAVTVTQEALTSGNAYLDGWSGGSVDDFIQQLVDECGVLCEDNPDADEDGVLFGEDNCPNDYNPSQADSDGDNIGDECDDCNDMSGDLNDDLVIDVLDVVNLVNIILVVNQNPTDCEFSDADYNNDSIVNIQDVILVITNILN